MGLFCRGYSLKNLCEFLHETQRPLSEDTGTEIRPAPRVRKENDMDVNTITKKKPSRVTEMQIGDTLFTVVSVESDRARERLYDKVKRMILNDENTETPPTATAA